MEQILQIYAKSLFKLLILRTLTNFFLISDSQRVHESIEGGIEKLEVSVENLNMRLARLLAEYTASQAKMKQRLAKLELKYVMVFLFYI